jgi:hypothetical protein
VGVARLKAVNGELVVHLSGLEQMGAMRSGVRVPLASITAVRVSDHPWSELRGIRAPGTGSPGVISLGRRRGRGTTDFAAVYGRGPAVVVDLQGVSFDRLVVSASDASGVAAAVQSARSRG